MNSDALSNLFITEKNEALDYYSSSRESTKIIKIWPKSRWKGFRRCPVNVEILTLLNPEWKILPLLNHGASKRDNYSELKNQFNLFNYIIYDFTSVSLRCMMTIHSSLTDRLMLIAKKRKEKEANSNRWMIGFWTNRLRDWFSDTNDHFPPPTGLFIKLIATWSHVEETISPLETRISILSLDIQIT